MECPEACHPTIGLPPRFAFGGFRILHECCAHQTTRLLNRAKAAYLLLDPPGWIGLDNRPTRLAVINTDHLGSCHHLLLAAEIRDAAENRHVWARWSLFWPSLPHIGQLRHPLAWRSMSEVSSEKTASNEARLIGISHIIKSDRQELSSATPQSNSLPPAVWAAGNYNSRWLCSNLYLHHLR